MFILNTLHESGEDGEGCTERRPILERFQARLRPPFAQFSLFKSIVRQRDGMICKGTRGVGQTIRW